jgi:hypothetical protein
MLVLLRGGLYHISWPSFWGSGQLLITSHFNSTMLEIPPEWLAHEYYQDDFHKVADIARSERGVSTLHVANGGDPIRSR